MRRCLSPTCSSTFRSRCGVLSTVAALLEDQRLHRDQSAVRRQPVAQGACARGAASGHTVSLADNLVHVNHFSAASLRTALERTGFTEVAVRTAAPELPPSAISRAVRLAIYAAGRLPGAVHTPLALNLQAYATRRAR